MRTIDISVSEAVLSHYANQELDVSPELAAPLGNVAARYDVLGMFAEGGFSTVHVAQDRNLRRFVAVKTLRPEVNGRDSFITEAKVIAQLDHPAILPVYDLAGDDKDGLHLSMKLVDGRTLRTVLHDDLPLSRRLDIFLKVCDAITYAHARNIIHGDLKPDNIIVGDFGEVYVVDWGLAQKCGPGGYADVDKVRGTLRYMAPETRAEAKLGKLSEVYTLGVILREVAGTDDRALQAIADKAAARDPEARYQTVEALADDLRRYLAGDPVSALPDTLPVRLVRWAAKHRQQCLVGALAVLLVCASITAAAIWWQLQVVHAARLEREALVYLSDRTTTAASNLDLTGLQIQEQLLALSRICAYLLEHNSGAAQDAWQTSFRPPLTEIGKTEDGMYYSPYYKRLTAMDYGLFTFAPDADHAAGVAFMRRTSPALRKMRNIVLGSMGGYNFDPAEYQRLQMAYLYDGSPVRSVFVGTEDGLKLLYPWRGSYPRDVDPRRREWYTAGRDRRSPVWGKPYMDVNSVSGLSIPCSAPIVGFDDKVRGVVGLDLSINKLVERILRRGNIGPYVIGKAVINRRGEEVFSSKSPYFNAKFDPEKFHEDAEFKLPIFASAEVRDRILRSGQEYGAFIASRRGQVLVYSFAYLEVWDMFFVSVADFGKLKQYLGVR